MPEPDQHLLPRNEHQQNKTDVVQPAEISEFGDLVVDDSDKDSALGDDTESITTSINSRAADYKFEHGRRYHAYHEEKYMLPNDNEEVQRLELQHKIWQLSLNDQLNLAPLQSNIKRALDIGCGTGAWVIEFAELFPNCQVVGTDLSPIQPTLVPPNVEFIVDDITSPWVYDAKFDYIHTRAITVGIKDWAHLVDQMWNYLEPGGWIEFQEYHAPFLSDDGTMALCPNFEIWNREMAAGAAKAGTRLDAILNVPKVLEERGFVNISPSSSKWPLGPWAKGKREKKAGELFEKDLATHLDGVSMRLFTKVLGWTREDVVELCKNASDEIRSRKMHTYMSIDFLLAQKPLNATT